MRSQPISEYIYCGTYFRYLLDAQSKWRLFDYDDGRMGMLHTIRVFLNNLETFGLPVTMLAADGLNTFYEKLKYRVSSEIRNCEKILQLKKRQKDQLKILYSRMAEDDWDAIEALRRDKVLPREVQEVLESQGLNVQAAELSKLMHSLLPTFEAECQAKLVFIVTEKRIDVHKLLFNVPKLMAPNVFKALPEITQFDFVQAGRCIAFELPTAAAFHVLRGTEAVLRHFYFSLTHKSDRVTWAQAVTALRQLNDSSLKPALDHLDNIRSNLRNPTLHPDVMEYNIEEAQDLFNLCIDAVNRMAGNSNWKPFP